MKKICAVVVTYNRLELLKRCIMSLQAQTYEVDKILIVNNHSTDGTLKYLSIITKKNKNLEIINLCENIGGAGGFERGIKRAYEEGFNWIWVMDDDSEPSKECLGDLMEYTQKENVGLIAPVIINKKTGHYQNYHHKIIDKSLIKDFYVSLDEIKLKSVININANAFVGPLISRSAINSVGFPRGDFFIWLDDTEYTYRISQNFDVLLITKAIIFHNDKIVKNNEVHDFWKQCYGSRNRWLWRHTTLKGTALYRGNIIAYIKYLKQLIKILFLKEWKGNRKVGLHYLLMTIVLSQLRRPGKFIDPVRYYSLIN